MPSSGMNIICDANMKSFTSDRFTSKIPTQYDAITASGIRTFINLDSKNWQQGGVTTVVSPSSVSPPLFSEIQNNHFAKQGETNQSSAEGTSRKGNRGGGRKPAQGMVKEENLSTEEWERMSVRRERNKQAAARCRKRRVDQTDTLQEDVNEWEHKKSLLQEEIQSLQAQREELQFILDAHKTVCNKKRIQSNEPSLKSILDIQLSAKQGPKVLVKAEPQTDATINHLTHQEAMETDLSSTNLPRTTTPSFQEKPLRPQSLGLNLTKGSNLFRSIGVSIETPTSFVSSLNFDALMDGRTGLTPTNVLTPISLKCSDNSINTPSITTPSGFFSQQMKSSMESGTGKIIRELASPNSFKLICL